MSERQNGIHKYEPLWGSWYVDELIGKGNFGTVYKISRDELGHKYTSAVKIISVPNDDQYREAEASFGGDDASLSGYFQDIVQNIVNEITTLYSLAGNSNIVGYHDHKVFKKVDSIGWDILIRMEYVTPLKKHIQGRGMDIEEVVRLGVDISSALALCSRKGLIHRDVKDDNLFVNDDGTFKLGDFGIAKELSKSGRAISMRGTPLYMAPEVFRGDSYGSSVDIYSLGIVLYKLLNHGRMPFMPPYPREIRVRDSDGALEKRMSGAALPPPDQAPQELAGVILKACAFRTEDRYHSPLEMKRDLEQALAGISKEKRAIIVTLPTAGREQARPNHTNQTVSVFDTKKVGTLDLTINPSPSPPSDGLTVGVFGVKKDEKPELSGEEQQVQAVEVADNVVKTEEPELVVPVVTQPRPRSSRSEKKSPGKKKTPLPLVVGLIAILAIGLGVWNASRVRSQNELHETQAALDAQMAADAAAKSKAAELAAAAAAASSPPATAVPTGGSSVPEAPPTATAPPSPPTPPASTSTGSTAPTGSSGSGTTSALSTPEIISPVNNTQVPHGEVVVTWGSVSGATSYTFTLTNDTTGVSIVNYEIVPNTSRTIPESLLAGGHRYRVSVNARFKDGRVSSYTHVSFTVPLPVLGKPYISIPGDNAQVPRGDVMVRWGSVSGASHYLVTVRNLTTGSLLIISEQADGLVKTIAGNTLTAGHRYRVSVSAVSSDGRENFSDPITFTSGNYIFGRTAEGQVPNPDLYIEFNDNGDAMMSLRALQVFGAKVAYDATAGTHTITYGSKTVVVTVGSPSVSVDGMALIISLIGTSGRPAPAYEAGGRVFIPVRFLEEHLRFTFAWETPYSVTISPPAS